MRPVGQIKVNRTDAQCITEDDDLLASCLGNARKGETLLCLVKLCYLTLILVSNSHLFTVF